MTSMEGLRPPPQAGQDTAPITIALISDGMLSRSYAGTMISGVHAGAAERGASVVLAQAKHGPRIASMDLGDLLARQMIGVIIASDGGGAVEVPSELERIPHVVLNARSLRAASQIMPDHDHAAQTVVRELIDAGHVRIGYVGGRASTRGGEWLRAVARALVEFEVFDPELVITDSPDAGGGHRSTITALRQPVPPTALICLDGRMAMGAYQAAQELGVVIPDRLSVIALDDAEILGEDLRPPLTTVHLPYFRMGQEAVRSLVGQIRDGQIRESRGTGTETRVACDIVRRQSVGAASPASAAPPG
jgi:LacI family transcriptional regulator